MAGNYVLFAAEETSRVCASAVLSCAAHVSSDANRPPKIPGYYREDIARCKVLIT